MYFHFKILSLIIIFVIIESCTKVIEIDLPDNESKVVVNSFFTDGQQFKVHLSKSISVLETTFPECNNAFIVLSENNTIIDTLHRIGAFYYSKIKAERGKDYSLTIRTLEAETVVCKDVIPDKILIQSYKVIDSIMIDEDGFPIMQLELNFTDPPGKNYYEISMLVDGVLWFEKNADPILTSTGLLDYNPRTLIFSDILFDNKPTSIKINYRIELNGTDIMGIHSDYDYLLDLSLRSVSDYYYKYKEKQVAYLFSMDSDIFSGMSEPVHLYSNISGGYGIFAGYTSDNKTINVSVR